MLKILSVVGTRPEAIKMAPILLRLQKAPDIRSVLIATAQHRELLDQVFVEFGVVPDYDLDLMEAGQPLAHFAGRCLAALAPILVAEAPQVVLAQGDTTTTLMAALASFYQQIPFAHVEAGLRTGDLGNPYPEEFNRLTISRICDFHFAPTAQARSNLLNEGVPGDSIMVSGNTVIDSLATIRSRIERLPRTEPDTGLRLLVTVHRRENFGLPLERICRAIETILSCCPDLKLTWPVHPNPEVKTKVHQRFCDHPRVFLTAPQNYGEFVRSMLNADVILTDSGGVQEEAPALGKPVLVLRDETERPEGISQGAAILVGTKEDAIVSTVLNVLNEPRIRLAMSVVRSPYGDGGSADRIVSALRERYGRAPVQRVA